METNRLYEFGPFRLDVANARLRRNGEAIPLPPKTFEVLRLLVSRAGSLVEKDVLMREVWPDTFVEEANVSRHIWALRKALGESGSDERYIETVPKRGYRFSADVRAIDQEATVGHSSTAQAVEPLPAIAAATSSRSLWVAAGGAILAVAVGVWALSARRAPLTDRDAILMADIENRTGDPVFDDTIKTALAVGLEQSPFLKVVPDETVRESLRLAGRDVKSRVTGDVAHDLCQRNAIKAVLAGSIASLGSHFAISLEAQECRTGAVLAREQAEADSKERVLPSLGLAIRNLRAKLGESISSIERFDAPLERATTSSLEALKAYSTGQSLRNTLGVTGETAAIPFYKRAIELDPDFGLAYHFLARIYQDLSRDLERARHYASEAYARRDRVSDVERLAITGAYHYTVTGDWEKAIEAFEVARARYPRDPEPANNVGVVYSALGMIEKQLDAYSDSIRRNPDNAIHIGNLAMGRAGQNEFAEARSILEHAIERGRLAPGNATLYEIAFAQGDAVIMQRELEAFRTRGAEQAFQPALIRTLMFGGQFKKAREVARSRGAATVAELRAAAEREALVGNRDESRRLLDQALPAETTPQGRADIAVTLAWLGDAARAQPLIDELTARFPEATVINKIQLPTARAALALRHGSASSAIAQLQTVLPYDRAMPAGVRAIYLRGEALLTSGNAAAAAAEFKKLTERRGRLLAHAIFPLSHLGLGRALAAAGDRTGATAAYAEFFKLWKDADADLPVLVQARQEFAALRK